MHTIYGVALGPGDPELITLKALRVLRDVDVIFYPGSSTNGHKKSFVYSMLEYHQLTEKTLQGFFLEMRLDRTAAERVYDDTAVNIERLYQQGKSIAIVCEGDLSLYASFSYVLKRLQERELPVSLIPGINAFSLGAAKHQIPISLQNERMAIVPKVDDIETIKTYFKTFDTLVLMKIRSHWETVEKAFKHKAWQCYYCERLGTEDEFISTRLQDISDREIPYFSLLIIKKDSKND